jgi:ribosomal protein S6
MGRLKNTIKEFRHENDVARQVLRHTIVSYENQLQKLQQQLPQGEKQEDIENV